MKNINLLILSRVTSWQGGVVNFVELMKSHYSSYFIYESFNVGCRIKCSFINKLFTPIHDVIKLHRHIRFSTYDVIQLNPSLNLPSLIRDGVFMLCLRFNNCSNVFVVWHGWNSKIAQRLEHWPWNFVFRKVFGYATAMWVLSSTFMRQLMAMGIPASKIQQFTTMFDGRIFHNLERSRNDDEIQLLFLSRFERAKGVYELLEAFNKILPTTRHNLKLHLAGDGPEMAGLRSWVNAHKLDDHIIFTGYLRDRVKAQALLNADIFVFPTYYGEGCPISLLEAMAAGLPIITAPAGGIPDIFQDGVNGYLLPHVTSDLIASSIEELLNDTSLRERFGATNRNEAWEKYEAKIVTQKFENFYTDLAHKNHGVLHG